VDFNADGHLDLMSGCYDPGSLHLFRGLGKGEYAAGEVIKDRSGKPVLTKPDQKQAFESFGSWVATVDWDGDQDLDLLIGGYGGELLLRINEGTRSAPEFAIDNFPLLVGGQPARIPEHHATPVVADWDGDSLWDIVSGNEAGGVCWLRNVGKLGEPRFESIEMLLPNHVGTGYAERLSANQPPLPGIRSQIDVVDFDNDGKLDLLVGDFCTIVTLRPSLTDQDRSNMEQIEAEAKSTADRLRKVVDDMRAAFDQKFPGETATSDEGTKEWTEMYRTMTESDEYKSLRTELDERRKELNRYFVKPDGVEEGGDYAVSHGYVWLYLRK
jgi:hypothetical protein